MTARARELAALAPDYDGGHVRHVMTSAAASLGLDGFSERLGLPSASIAVVLMVDGLGDELIARHSGHARFLASAWRRSATGQVIDATAPATTAASIASLGTGEVPGRHGLVGYDVLAPWLDRVVNMLGGWDPAVDPARWQPHMSVLSRAERGGARVLTVSRPKFADSPLTRAVLAGGEFLGANRMDARFRMAADAVHAHRPETSAARQGSPQPLLMYLYVDELDKTGHRYGVDSPEWIRALETLDAEAEKFVTRLGQRFGDQFSAVLTADHGMLDIAPQGRLDFGQEEALLRGVRHTGGEPRFVHVYFDKDASPAVRRQVHEAWEERFGDQAWICTRDEAIDAGWFGLVEDRVRPRIGDLLIAVHGPLALYHTERTGTDPLQMIGQHGSLTDAEIKVPLLSLTGRPFG
ncbi:alkaline phosphatase family protein [Nesterenkonia sp. HG001]|uniref:alkaline phosphatase family protein n=1 Tax=Nesterenkonia sp. HG001 TaxID=2983207 RepID=UPI002AC66EA7|nr:alkaline phosphatase family protein [Nesterenkonia sp. HG001]MDZ5078372.1 alkaline phosphatase family protein [Nesterenkonia sp. HG001]